MTREIISFSVVSMQLTPHTSRGVYLVEYIMYSYNLLCNYKAKNEKRSTLWIKLFFLLTTLLFQIHFFLIFQNNIFLTAHYDPLQFTDCLILLICKLE